MKTFHNLYIIYYYVKEFVKNPVDNNHNKLQQILLFHAKQESI